MNVRYGNYKCMTKRDKYQFLLPLFSRCTTYTSIPSQCTLVADPKDPECCEVPQCITVPPNPTNGTIVITGVTGQPMSISC